MYKLFNYFFSTNDKTAIDVKVTHQESPAVDNPYSISSVWRCTSNDEFTKIYDQTKRESEKLQSKFADIQLKVELSGTLKGLKMNAIFHDLASYHLYLENNSLLCQPDGPLRLNMN